MKKTASQSRLTIVFGERWLSREESILSAKGADKIFLLPLTTLKLRTHSKILDVINVNGKYTGGIEHTKRPKRH